MPIDALRRCEEQLPMRRTFLVAASALRPGDWAERHIQPWAAGVVTGPSSVSRIVQEVMDCAGELVFPDRLL